MHPERAALASSRDRESCSAVARFGLCRPRTEEEKGQRDADQEEQERRGLRNRLTRRIAITLVTSAARNVAPTRVGRLLIRRSGSARRIRIGIRIKRRASSGQLTHGRQGRWVARSRHPSPHGRRRRRRWIDGRVASPTGISSTTSRIASGLSQTFSRTPASTTAREGQDEQDREQNEPALRNRHHCVLPHLWVSWNPSPFGSTIDKDGRERESRSRPSYPVEPGLLSSSGLR